MMYCLDYICGNKNTHWNIFTSHDTAQKGYEKRYEMSLNMAKHDPYMQEALV